MNSDKAQRKEPELTT